MRQFLVRLTALFLLVSAAVAQTPDTQQSQPPAPPQASPDAPEPPSQPAQTQTPEQPPAPPASRQVTLPAGTYVKGRITHIQRPGRIKGRAELQVHFTSMVFPNGYTVDLPGTLVGTPGSYNHQVTDEEGTVKANGTKG